MEGNLECASGPVLPKFQPSTRQKQRLPPGDLEGKRPCRYGMEYISEYPSISQLNKKTFFTIDWNST
ncbi:hypothetical protein TNCT_99021 [Trichonephila clavata]|uniref:Uncharacterized protein n=1 Tax=Trichonephila clavata TaxID=2740835 RepID=A0A8X6H2U5_TRICU|nr:hypothetical protein TNCT_99021 [Trichonephila clavata]